MTRRNEYLFYVNTFATSIFFTVTGVACTVGVFLTCLVRELGGSEKAVSFIPVAWCLAALPSTLLASLSERIGRHRELSIVTLILACCVASVNALLLILLPHHPALLGFTLASLVAGHVVSNLYMISYLAWMPDAVGQDRVGRVMSGRLFLWSLAQLVSLPLCGWIFQHFPGIQTFGKVFLGASGIGLVAAFPLAHISPSIRHGSREIRNPFQAFSLLKDRDISRMMGMVFLVNMSCFFIGAYGVVFVKEFLAFPYKLVGIAYAIPSLLMMASILGWGRLADLAGAKGPCLIGVCGFVVCPFLFFLNAPGHTHMVWLGMAWSGAICSAYSASWLPMLFSLSPSDKRSSGLALIWLACSLAGLVTPYLGGVVVKMAGNHTVTLLSWSFGGLHLLFLGQALIALPAVPLCRSIRLEASVPARHLVRLFVRSPWRFLGVGAAGDVQTLISGQRLREEESGNTPPSGEKRVG